MVCPSRTLLCTTAIDYSAELSEHMDHITAGQPRPHPPQKHLLSEKYVCPFVDFAAWRLMAGRLSVHLVFEPLNDPDSKTGTPVNTHHL